MEKAYKIWYGKGSRKSIKELREISELQHEQLYDMSLRLMNIEKEFKEYKKESLKTINETLDCVLSWKKDIENYEELTNILYPLYKKEIESKKKK